MLVSCIMPTHNRREFIPLALTCYLGQDWPHRELVVIDDGTDRVEDLFHDIEGARYLYRTQNDLPAHRPKTPIGTKRNWACEEARGEVIVHWDDDDWSAPGRITDQVNRLLASGKSVTGYNKLLFWHVGRREASRYINDSAVYACGSSLCYRRDWWEKNRFAETSNGEDNDFVYKARDARQIVSVPGGHMLVARTHSANSCPRDALSWPRIETRELPAEFLAAVGE